MGLFDSLKNRFRNNDAEDEYYLDDDYYDDSDDGYYDEEADEPQQKSGGIFSRFSGSRGGSDDEQPQRSGGLFGRGKVVPINGQSNMKVTMTRPANLNDARVIADDLLNGQAVVINLEGINTDIAQRIIDFTQGSVYSISGDLQMISRYIFIASPSSVELTGDFQGDFNKSYSGRETARNEVKRASGMSYYG